MIQNLTNDNFFNELHDGAPEAVEYFFRWFYDYQKEVGWHDLFGHKVIDNVAEPYRFTDIPFEMQCGIMVRFELELLNNKKGQGKQEFLHIADRNKDQMRKLFLHLQKQIERMQQTVTR